MNLKETGKVKFFIRYLSVELYYPYIIWNNINWGIKLDTFILAYKRYQEREWLMAWSLAFKLLGFGVGFAWKHCDNPIMSAF